MTVHRCVMYSPVSTSLLTMVRHNSPASSSDMTPATLAAQTEAPYQGMEESLKEKKKKCVTNSSFEQCFQKIYTKIDQQCNF